MKEPFGILAGIVNRLHMNYIDLCHFGINVNKELHEWFVTK